MMRPGLSLWVLAVAPLLASGALGCAEAMWKQTDSGMGGAGASYGEGANVSDGGSGASDSGDSVCGPLTDIPLDSLTPCCSQFGGAHCIPSVPVDFQALVESCPEGGFCVPDDFILQGGAVQPEKCLSIGDADGRWISGCVPMVAENAALLPTDDAHAGMFCVPCVNPLDQSDTGVCKIGTTCGDNGEDTGGGGSGGGSDATCDDPGTPIDPSILPACPNACGGRCVNVALLPDPNDPSIAMLEECSPGSGTLCVPDEMVASKGLGVPTTCDWYGLEGRCMSACIPEIAKQASEGFLTQGSCGANHYCAPCYDPITDEPTGACGTTCDAGPNPAKAHDLPGCCDGIGTCVPKALAGDKADQLGEDSCPQGGGLVCAPNDLMPGSDFVPPDCTPSFNLIDLADPSHAYGKCLPACIPGLDSFFLNDTGECGQGYACAPCWQPAFFYDSETDAPGCEY